jgi:hypothetical protein
MLDGRYCNQSIEYMHNETMFTKFENYHFEEKELRAEILKSTFALQSFFLRNFAGPSIGNTRYTGLYVKFVNVA